MFFKKKAPADFTPVDVEKAKEATAADVVRFYSAARLSFDGIRIEAMGYEGPPMPLKAITESISCGLAVDNGSNYVRVTQQMLDRWGSDFDHMLIDTARRCLAQQWNMTFMSGLGMLNDEVIGPALWICPDVAQSLVKGTPIMVGVDRTHMLLMQEGDSQSIDWAARYCRTALDGEEFVESVTPTRWDGNRWESLTWEGLGVGSDRAKAITMRYDSRNYARAKPALKQLYETRDEYPIAASFQMFADKDGKEFSSASIVDGQTESNIIPATDYVIFVYSDGRASLMLPWEVASAHCEFRALGLSPQWYQVVTIPSHEQLSSLM